MTKAEDSPTTHSSSSPDSHESQGLRSRITPSPTKTTPLPALIHLSPQKKRYSPLSSSSPPKRRLFRSSQRHYLRIGFLILMGASMTLSLSFLYNYIDQPVNLEVTQVTSPGLRASSPIRPRVLFYEGASFSSAQGRILMDDYMLHAAPGEEAVPQDIMRPEADENCIPMADWQTNSFPNCNAFHEMDLPLATDESPEEVSMELLGTGWFRSTWKWSVKGDQSVVLKTLRLDREFYDEYFELHRRDAVAMERLAHSPFVMNIYGYCGQSALNELADFNWDSMEKFNRNMRGRKATPALNFLKLQLSSSVAVGIAHVHEIDDRPSMVHYDVNPRNVAMVGGGRPKLNDFNTAEFLRYNPKTNKTCGFRGRLHEPWWRAPEEVAIGNSNVLDEKVDVYALGNVLFHILTTKSPRGKLKRERMEEVRQVVLDGVPPEMDPEFAESTDPALVAIRTAIEMCYEPDPVKRPSSRQIAEVLMETLVELRSKFKKSR